MAGPTERGGARQSLRCLGDLTLVFFRYLSFAMYVACVLLLLAGLICYGTSWFVPGLSRSLPAIWIACAVSFGVMIVADGVWMVGSFGFAYTFDLPKSRAKRGE